MFGIKSRLERNLPRWWVTIQNYRAVHGRFPNLIRPQTFNEKVLHRIVFDRRPVLTQVADKWSVRSYVESRLGPQILPEVYYVTTRPETIRFDKLPNEFVIKATHGCQWVQIVTDKNTLDCAAAIQTCAGWLKQSYYEFGGEWPYKNIEPRIIVERLINDGSGGAPIDYKLFVFDGKVELVQVDVDRFTNHRRGLYSCGWEKLDVLLEFGDICSPVSRPPHLADMISAAEALGRGLDFVRVDFYDTSERFYLGELTTTPGGGMDRFRPQQFDRYLGDHWKLPQLSGRALLSLFGA